MGVPIEVQDQVKFEYFGRNFDAIFQDPFKDPSMNKIVVLLGMGRKPFRLALFPH